MKFPCFAGLIIVANWLTVGVPCPGQSIRDRDVLLHADFDGGSKSGLAAKLIQHKHVTLVPRSGPDRSDAIRVDYVGYPRGSERVVMRYPLTRAADRVTLSFDVKFDDDFQWARGGKLHGVGPDRPVTGGNPRRPESWSARMMFRPDGRCATYLYDQNPDKKYGIGDTTEEPVFKAGRWHHVEFEVQLNSPGNQDGFAAVRIDGNQVTRTDGVRFRQEAGKETMIQQFLFSTFHGGHTPNWAPVDAQGNFTTVSAFYDNFLIAEGVTAKR